MIVPRTLYDVEGEVIGAINSEGQIVAAAPSHVGHVQRAWRDDVAAIVDVGVVVWDGAAKTPGQRNKGQLMDHYVPNIEGGPTFAGMNYSNRTLLGKPSEAPASAAVESEEDSPF